MDAKPPKVTVWPSVDITCSLVELMESYMGEPLALSPLFPTLAISGTCVYLWEEQQ